MTNPPKIEPPRGLSDDALDLFSDVVDERADNLGPERFAALIQACRLVSLADRAETAMGDNLMIPGSAGQMVPNGLLTEVRLGRAAAVTALKAAGLQPNVTAASAAGTALVAARYRRSAMR